jgi:tetratricopeptide (TPR) repeat protein
MQRIIFVLLSWLFLAAAAPAMADQNDPRLNDLFARLQKTDNRLEAETLENMIWGIWYSSDDVEVTRLMDQGERAMAAQDMRTAIGAFTKIIEIAPDFAEGWNRRATALYMIGEYEASRADVAETLAREPRHFGALSGLGLINEAEDRGEEAIEAWEKALEVNPNMPSVQQHIEEMKAKLADENI